MKNSKFQDSSIVKITFLIFGCGLLILGAFLCYSENVAGGTATYGVGILCFIFSFLTSFEHFEGFGIKAKLLDQKIEEADAVVAKLQSMSLPIAELLFAQVSRSGRWGAMIPRRDRYELGKNIEKELVNLGLSVEKIEGIKKDWHHFNIFDLANPIFKKIQTIYQEKITEKRNEMQQIPQPISSENAENHKVLVEQSGIISKNMDSFLSLLQQKNLSSLSDDIDRFITESSDFIEIEREKIKSDIQQQMDDLKYYENHKQFRNLENWFEQDEKG